MAEKNIITDFTEDKFVDWATGVVEDIVKDIRSNGIGAYITGVVARNMLLGKKRPFKSANITIIGNDKSVVLTVRRALAMRGFKRIGELYQKPNDLIADEWIIESDTFQLFVYVNYNRLEDGLRIPANPNPLFIREDVMDVFALIYEAYGVLVKGKEPIEEVVSDIKGLIKLQAMFG
jgi:hypothetical protein